jgi:phosphatidate cytidylyltransferase
MPINRELLVIFSEIAGVMVLWSLTGLVLKARARDGSTILAADDFNVRVRSWWWMAMVLGAALVAGRVAIIILFALISWLALREFLTISRLRQADHRAMFTCFVIATPVQYFFIANRLTTAAYIFVPMFAAIAIPCLVWFSKDRRDLFTRVRDLTAALMICVYAISYVPALFLLIVDDRGMLLILFLIVVTQLSDVLQYTFGKLLGRHKIAPRISPNKTMEGTIGGIAGATLVGASVWRMTPFTPTQTLAVTFVITCAGFAGGLILSAVKRDRGIKDWGHLIPGHGGILDRLDSIWLSAPLLFYMEHILAAR